MRGILRQAELVIYAYVIYGAAFIIQPTPNGVVTIQALEKGMKGIPLLLSSLLVFLVMAFILVCLFRTAEVARHLSVFSAFLRVGPVLLGIRLIFDGINGLLSRLLPSFTELFLLFTESACLWLLFFAAGKMMRWEKRPYGSRRRAALIVIGILLLLLAGWYLFCFSRGYTIQMHEQAKYAAYEQTTAASSHSFKMQLRLLFCNALLWAFLSYRYRFFSVGKQRVEEAPRYWNIFVARMLSILFAVPLCMAVEIMLLPQGVISSIKRPALSYRYFSGEKSFAAGYHTWIITRMSAYGEPETVFEETRVDVMYGKDCLLTFVPEVRRDKPARETLIFEEEESYGRTCRYGFDVLAYHKENGEPAVLRFCEINEYPEKDEALLAALKQLVQDGYFEGFEFSVQYLLKYDRSFVLPYIEKYARGDLSPEEREKNRYLNPDYMTAFAKEIVV